MALSYKDDQQADERLNPADTARDLYKQEQAGGHDAIDGYDRKNDGLDDHPITAGDASGSSPFDASANIRNTQAGEQAPKNPINYVGTGNKKTNTNSKIKNFVKKKGPMSLIVSLLFGGGAISTIMFSPGIAIVQFKEILVGDLNDQVRAMNVFNDHMLRAKLDDMKSGVCTQKVSIRCKFSTMSKKEVENFKKAGFSIEPDTPDKVFSRTKPTKITTPSGTVLTSPNQISAYLKDNPQGRAEFTRAYNPKFAGLADKVSTGVFSRFKTSKAEKITGSTEEEQEKAVSAATAGEAVDLDTDGFKTDSEGRSYVTDENGNRIYKEQPSTGSLPPDAIVDEGKFNTIVEENKVKLGELKEGIDASKAGKSAAADVAKAGFKGISALGALDTACTVWNTARAVSAAAKVARGLQLAQFAMVFLNVADRIKSGTATPEEVTFAGTALTSVDTNQQIPSTTEEGKMVDNPYYGANAFDSAGYHTAAYNEAPILTARDTQFMVGGALAGELAGILNTVAAAVGGKENIRSTCKIVQSWWARTVGFVGGLLMAAGSFGTSTALSIAGSMAFGFAMPFLQAQLKDIIAGKAVSGKTKGVDVGSAGFSGTATLLGSMAAGHGLMLGNKSQLKGYMAATEDIHQQYIAAERYEARKTPFDIYNQYSFLGSALRTINPPLIKTTSSLSGAITNLPSIISAGFASIIPTAKAQQTFNDRRFSRCTDPGYEDLGVDPDVFCNGRFFAPREAMAISPDDAFTWMSDNGHIEDDGTPKSDSYKDWMKHCTQREDGWGETSEDDDNSDKAIGLICVTKNKNSDDLKLLYNFIAFHNYEVNQHTRDNGYDNTDVEASSIETIVSPVASGFSITSGYGPRGAIPGAPNASKWHPAIDLVNSNRDVYAIAAGKVESISGAGNTIVIKHADGLKSRYTHIYREDTLVQVGDDVEAGQKIGLIGCAGKDAGICKGDHLDFSIWIDEVTNKAAYSKYKTAPDAAGGSAGKSINPANFLKDKNVGGYEGAVNDN